MRAMAQSTYELQERIRASGSRGFRQFSKKYSTVIRNFILSLCTERSEATILSHLLKLNYVSPILFRIQRDIFVIAAVWTEGDDSAHYKAPPVDFDLVFVGCWRIMCTVSFTNAAAASFQEDIEKMRVQRASIAHCRGRAYAA
eukprot:IDg4537t1